MKANEIEEEIKYLEQKRIHFGWTQQDAIRYEWLKSLMAQSW
jgi:hypothetical protein